MRIGTKAPFMPGVNAICGLAINMEYINKVITKDPTHLLPALKYLYPRLVKHGLFMPEIGPLKGEYHDLVRWRDYHVSLLETLRDRFDRKQWKTYPSCWQILWRAVQRKSQLFRSPMFRYSVFLDQWNRYAGACERGRINRVTSSEDVK